MLSHASPWPREIRATLHPSVSVSVEIERSHKNLRRYHQRFSEILSEPSRPTLYLVEDPQVLNVVRTGYQSALESLQVRAEKPQSKIHLCLYKEAENLDFLKAALADLFDQKDGPQHGHVKPQLGTG